MKNSIAGAAGIGIGVSSLFENSIHASESRFSRELDLKWGQLVKHYIAEEAFPGCVIYVAQDGNTIYHRPFGRFMYDVDSTPVSPDTIYGLASVTKVTANLPMVMKLWEQKKLRLDMHVSDFFPEFSQGEKSKVTIQHVITHSTGLPSGSRLYARCSSYEEVIQAILATPLKHPVGTVTEYSDFGMILMANIIEKIYGETLDVIARREIHEPLRMVDTMYRPLPELKYRIAPTEIDPWRGRLVHGDVHDENAYAMGGVSGHAGLFSTARDLGRYCQCLLNGGVLDGARIFNPETIEFFSQRPEDMFPGQYALGWRIPPYRNKGRLIFSPGSIGHTGYTGTCIWMDRQRNTQVVILSNRVYPTRRHRKIGRFRGEFLSLVFESLFAG